LVQTLTPDARAGATPAVADRSGTATRILDAFLACVARVGVAKTTLDDVAREAGCSRATVYRYFDSKDALVAAAVARESGRLEAALAQATRGEPDLASATTAVLMAAAGFLGAHDALRFVLLHEPDLLLPHVSFERSALVLDAGADLVVAALAPHLAGHDAHRFGEWVTRIALSYLLCPSEHVSFSDPASVRALVDELLVPALVPLAPTPSEVL
jgi:AcrR family transcriptional regulator